MIVPARRRAAARARWPALALGLACLGLEAALWGAEAGLWGSAGWRPRTYQNGAFWPGLLGDWRANYPAQPAAMFFSHALLHAGPGHLAGNLAALALLLRLLGPRLDAGRFLALWLVSVPAGALAFALVPPGPQPMVGASGGLFGLAGAWAAWEAARRRAAGLPFGPVWRALAIVVGLHPLVWAIEGGLLAWQAHLGGALAGAALARGLGPAAAPAFRARNGPDRA